MNRMKEVSKKRLFIAELEQPLPARAAEMTTMMVGEESLKGGDITTEAYGEECLKGDGATTLVIGEESCKG